MFAIAFLIGLYANVLFLLGIAKFYQPTVILGMTFIFIFLSIIFWDKFDEKGSMRDVYREFGLLLKSYPFYVALLIISGGLILFGALAPELSFDALWYHLTLPKIFLMQHGINYIPGGLFYYSTMPKLGELLYIGALSMSNEILAKLIHASFAFLTGIVIYILARKYTDRKYALLAVVMFFSNIVVLWEATTAYIDLIRTFFELMSFWGLLTFLATSKRKWLIESGLLMGLAVESKMIALSSVIIMVIVLFRFQKWSYKERLKDLSIFALCSLIPSLGWFVLSYLSTGNPFYPLFTHYTIHLGQDTLAFPALLVDPITVFFSAADPVSPIYLIIFPLFFVVRKRLPANSVPVFVFAVLSLLVWSVTPKTGGGRFLVPYLPVFSVAAAIIISQLKEKKLSQISLISVTLCMVLAIAYRGIATVKYVPVVLGLETKQHFLSTHLNYSFGDYSDTDGEMARLVKPSSTILLYGFHNLYYMDSNFIDSSWVQKGDRFEYIAIQNTSLPLRFRYWRPVYANKTTGVTLYTINTTWIY